MLFFPENPELAFLYLYHLRLQEAERERRIEELRGAEPGLTAKVRMAFEYCWVRARAINSRPQPGTSADPIVTELGKLPQ